MMMQIVGSFAEFEREMLKHRTRSGLNAARKEEHVGGCRPKLKEIQKKEIIDLICSNKKTATQAAKLFNIHPSTISKILRDIDP